MKPFSGVWIFSTKFGLQGNRIFTFIYFLIFSFHLNLELYERKNWFHTFFMFLFHTFVNSHFKFFISSMKHFSCTFVQSPPVPFEIVKWWKLWHRVANHIYISWLFRFIISPVQKCVMAKKKRLWLGLKNRRIIF